MGTLTKKESTSVLVLEGLGCANCAAKINLSKPDKKHGEQGIDLVKMLRLMLGFILFLSAFFLKLSYWLDFGLFFAGYLLVGGEVVLKAAKKIARGQVFDEHFLMTVATIGAFVLGEFAEGVAVMLFYRVGEFLQDLAVDHSRKSISALMDIRPDYANLKQGDKTTTVSPDEVHVGDLVIVKPGEKVPLDGIVKEGSTLLDTSAITGESLPREVGIGQEVYSGSINKSGLFVIEVTKEFGESTVSKILDLVQNASSKKAPTENFITKFARFYSPVVFFAAIALAVIPPLVLPGALFAEWIRRALVFLVISCPCALVISIPLGFFGGIGGASKYGILFKGSNYLEALNAVDTIVFDKTGTLTKGVFEVTKIISAAQGGELQLLEYAAYAESFSNHPIAQSILHAYGMELHCDDMTDYDEVAGYGVKATVKANRILAGNSRFMTMENIPFIEPEEVGTIVHIASNGNYIGYIVISDDVKKDSAAAIRDLRKIGIEKLLMFTGDSKTVGEKIGRQLGLDGVLSELLPAQKVEELEKLEQNKQQKSKILFVGDGINDAPVLTRADVGVAMGSLGSDAAIEAADIVIMTDEPSKIVCAIKIAKKTRKIVWQNIVFAFIIKGVFLILGASGLANMWEAVFADVGVTILAVFNALRVLHVGNL